MLLTRRDVLQKALGASTLMALGHTAPAFLAHTAAAARASRTDRDTVLVVLQLTGGNDGLNTIVPYEDDAYHRARDTLRLTAPGVIKVAPGFGFHPAMRPFERLYKEGRVAVLHGIGYPNPQPNHGEAMHVWQTADPAYAQAQTGWVGRAADALARPDDPAVAAAFVGDIPRPAAVNARRAIVPTYRTLEAAALQAGRAGGDTLATLARLAESPRPADPLLQFAQKATLEAHTTARQIEEAAGAKPAPGAYPQTQFARQLNLIARLIRAVPGVRLYYTELGGVEPGGFDTHAGQALNHGALLQQLTEGVAAFADDLARDRLLDRVLLVTFSEFGRTVQENGRRGTDHGSAQPLFLVGGRVQGGLIGRHPSLTDLENGGQRHHTDFRSVYATLLERWLVFPSAPVLGRQFGLLDVLKNS